MRRWITLRSLLALAIVALIAMAAVSACGGDDEDGSRSRTPTAEVATPPDGANSSTPGPQNTVVVNGTPGIINNSGQFIPATFTPRPGSDPESRSTIEAAREATEDAEDAADDAAEETEEAGDVDVQPPGN